MIATRSYEVPLAVEYHDPNPPPVHPRAECVFSSDLRTEETMTRVRVDDEGKEHRLTVNHWFADLAVFIPAVHPESGKVRRLKRAWADGYPLMCAEYHLRSDGGQTCRIGTQGYLIDWPNCPLDRFGNRVPEFTYELE